MSAAGTGQGRLLAASPAPPGWRPGWSPGGPVRRCGACGARVVVRSSRFTRCAAGCVTFPARPPRPVPAPPPPPPAERARYRKLVQGLRVLEAGFVRDARRGRPPSAWSVELAMKALRLFREACPHHLAEIAAALPWLSREAGRAGAA